MSEEYKKSFEDELDWNLLDQLHKVVLQISSFCFRTKQICLTVDIAIIGLLIKFTVNKLDTSIFVAGLLIPLGFWFLDAVAYYYQVKIRAVMDSIRDRLSQRNLEAIVDANTQRVISRERVSKPWGERLVTALFNQSMWFYGFLSAADVAIWIMWHWGIIGT